MSESWKGERLISVPRTRSDDGRKAAGYTNVARIANRRRVVKALFENGKTQAEIANAVRVGIPTVQSDLRFLGLVAPAPVAKGSSE